MVNHLLTRGGGGIGVVPLNSSKSSSITRGSLVQLTFNLSMLIVGSKGRSTSGEMISTTVLRVQTCLIEQSPMLFS